MKKLSATMITWNEEKKVERALLSLKGVADEVIVVDSYSTDRTKEICQRLADRFVQTEWRGYRDQKQYALDQAQHEWVLSLDADEVLGDALKTELETWKRDSDTAPAGYYLPRKTFFMGRWIEHTSWHPDWQLRLFRKSCSRWSGGRVHEVVQVNGSTGRFQNPIEHYTYSDVSEYLAQLQNFSSLAAADYFDRGQRSSPAHFVLLPCGEFFKNFVLRRGFQDGAAGLVVSLLSSISVFFKFLKLWELQKRGGGRKQPSKH